MAIADYYAIKQEFWAQYAGPGHWNDPDMVFISNYNKHALLMTTRPGDYRARGGKLQHILIKYLRSIQLE